MSKIPKINLLLALLLLLLLAIPYKSITFSNNKLESRVANKKEKHKLKNEVLKETYISISCIHKPQKIEIFQDKELILSSSEMDFEEDSNLTFLKKNGKKVLVFDIQADWGESLKRSALQIKVEPENMETRAITLWSNGLVDESITFSWEN